MTSPGGGGPIETAYIEIKPQVSADFAKNLKKELKPILKQVAKDAEEAFSKVGESARGAGKGVSAVTRSLNSASKAAQSYATHATSASNASSALARNASSAGSALRNVGGHAGTASDGARKAGSSFNFLTRALVIGAVYTAGKALKDLGAFGLGAAAQLEQTQIAFQGLFGDAQVADQFTKKLQAFANVTPFEFQGLAQASQRLIAIHMSGDQALSTLKTIGNAAAAVGAPEESINRVVLAISQIQAKGKLSAEELNQVAEALPNLDRADVIQNLATQFGKTTTEIQDLQQKGMIPANAGIQALLESLQKVPGAMGAMDRQAKTLQGRLSTFKDTVKTNFSNALVDALPFVGDALDQLTVTVGAQLEKFGPALGDALVGILPLVEGFVNLLGPLLTDLMNTLVPLLNQLSPALAPIGDAISTILDALGPALVPLAAAIAQVAAAMAPIAGQLGVAMANALVAVTPLIIMFANNIIALMNFLETHQKLVGDVAALWITFFATFKAYKIISEAIAVMKTLGIVTFATTLVQEGLNAALKANPIGAVITVASALVGVFVLLYRHSETFRKGILFLRDHLIDAFKFMLDAVILWATSFVLIAAKAFGWVPGIGPKLKAAADAVYTFKDNVNAALDKITKRVDIHVVTTYTVEEKKEAARLDNRQQRINKAYKAAAPGGRINQLTQEEKADIARHVDQVIAYENAQAKKRKPPKEKPDPKSPFGPASLLPDKNAAKKAASEAEKAAKKAAAAAHKAAVRAADSVLKLAKTTASGIKKNLGDAEDSLKKLRDQFAEIRDAIRDAFTVDLFDSHSAKSFLRKVGKNITKNTATLTQQQTITDKLGNTAGASEFTRQLFESGNRKLIKSLAGQSAATLREVVDKFNKNRDLATQIGTAVASAYRVEGKPLVVGIAQVRDEVIKLRADLVKALAAVAVAQKARDKLKAASGGIFNSTTDLQVAEAGREVVVPLTRPKTALDLLLRSGALGLPTVAAHLASLEGSAQAQSLDHLRRLGAGVPTSSRFSQPVVKVVKERSVQQTFNIHGAKDPRLTAASVAARTAEHLDR